MDYRDKPGNDAEKYETEKSRLDGGLRAGNAA